MWTVVEVANNQKPRTWPLAFANFEDAMNAIHVFIMGAETTQPRTMNLIEKTNTSAELNAIGHSWYIALVGAPIAAPLTKLDTWFALTETTPALVKQEKDLRLELFNEYFPAPVIGVNRYSIGHSKDLKATYKMSYTIDRKLLEEKQAEIAPELLHRMIKFDPRLSEGEWNSATVEEQKAFGEIVTQKPSLPAMEIANVKKR